MLLEVGKALSFFASILSLYPVVISAFFTPAVHWEERVLLAAPRVAIAGCACLLSGLLFRWPARSNPDRGLPITSTIPVRVFLWSIPSIAVLFALAWYLVCGGAGCASNPYACS